MQFYFEIDSKLLFNLFNYYLIINSNNNYYYYYLI